MRDEVERLEREIARESAEERAAQARRAAESRRITAAQAALDSVAREAAR